MARFLRFISVLAGMLLCSRYVAGAYIFRESRLCDPGNNNITPYSGFRIFRRYHYGWPTRHYWHMVHCSYGQVDYSQYFATNRTSDFSWTAPLCIAPDLCYSIVRRKRYSQRKVPMYASNVMVGGMYKCQSADNCTENAVPILPVLADSSSYSFQYWHHFNLIKYVPFLYTPDFTSFRYPRVVSIDGVPTWSRKLDLHENYAITNVDRAKPWYSINFAINKLAEKTTINDKYVPWEFDAASHEFERTRWRDAIRKNLAELNNLSI